MGASSFTPAPRNAARNSSCRFHRAGRGIEQVVVGQAQAARDMAGTKARPRLGHLALVAFVGARIDHLLGPGSRDFRSVCCMLRVRRASNVALNVAGFGVTCPSDLAAFATHFFRPPLRMRTSSCRTTGTSTTARGRGDPATEIVQHDDIVIADHRARRHRVPNCSADGNMCGSGLEWSDTASTSKNTAPGKCDAR